MNRLRTLPALLVALLLALGLAGALQVHADTDPTGSFQHSEQVITFKVNSSGGATIVSSTSGKISVIKGGLIASDTAGTFVIADDVGNALAFVNLQQNVAIPLRMDMLGVGLRSNSGKAITLNSGTGTVSGFLRVQLQ